MIQFLVVSLQIRTCSGVARMGCTSSVFGIVELLLLSSLRVCSGPTATARNVVPSPIAGPHAEARLPASESRTVAPVSRLQLGSPVWRRCS